MKKFTESRKFNIFICIFMPLLMILVLAGAYTGTLYGFVGMTAMEKIFVKKEKYKIKSDCNISFEIENANVTILRSKTAKARVYLKAPENTPEEEKFSVIKKSKSLQITDLAPADSGGVKLPFAKGTWNREFWIYLPEKFAGSLTITQKSGNFQTEIALGLESFSLSCGNGDVSISELEAAKIDVDIQNGSLVLSSVAGSGSITGSNKVTLGVKALSGNLKAGAGADLTARLLLDPPYRLHAAGSKLRIGDKIAAVKKSQKQFSGDIGENPLYELTLVSDSKATISK